MAVRKKTVKKKTVKKKTVKRKTVKKKTVKRKAVKKKTVKRKVVKKKTAKKTVRKKVVRKKTTNKRKVSVVAKRKKSRKRKAPRTRGNAPRWRKKSTIGEIATNLGVGLAGAIGTAQLANRTNIQNPKIKAAIPLGLGFALLMSKWGKKDFVAYLSTGAMFMGGLSLVKQFNPQLVEIAGDYPNTAIDYEDQLMLDDMSGTVDFGEDDFLADDSAEFLEMGENVDLEGDDDDDDDDEYDDADDFAAM